jgi:hypothetical protein
MSQSPAVTVAPIAARVAILRSSPELREYARAEIAVQFQRLKVPVQVIDALVALVVHEVFDLIEAKLPFVKPITDAAEPVVVEQAQTAINAAVTPPGQEPPPAQVDPKIKAALAELLKDAGINL